MSRQNLVQVTCDRCGDGGTSLPEMTEERLAIDEDGRGGWATLGKFDLCPSCKMRPTTVTLSLTTSQLGVGEMADMLVAIANDLRRWTELPRQELYMGGRDNQGASCRVLMNKDEWDDKQ